MRRHSRPCSAAPEDGDLGAGGFDDVLMSPSTLSLLPRQAPWRIGNTGDLVAEQRRQ